MTDLQIMKNAKKEFLTEVEGKSVLCAEIRYGNEYWDKELTKDISLRLGFSINDWNGFIALLDFDYDDGFGSQELFGTIWYENGSWSERYEYDGAECWHYKCCPIVPENLKEYSRL